MRSRKLFLMYVFLAILLGVFLETQANSSIYNFYPNIDDRAIRDCIEGVAGACASNCQPGSGLCTGTLAAGDVVNLAPGNYFFGAHMTTSGTASQHIVIQGTDPAHPAVFDLSAYELYDESIDRLPEGAETWGAGIGELALKGKTVNTCSMDGSRAFWGVCNAGYIEFKNIHLRHIHGWDRQDGTNAWMFQLASGTNIYMTNCTAEDADEGLWFRTADSPAPTNTETVEVRSCKFTDCGCTGTMRCEDSHYIYALHPIYIESGNLDMQFSEISNHAVDGGNSDLINNRAARSDIRYCYFHHNSNQIFIMNHNHLNYQGQDWTQEHIYVGNIFDLRDPTHSSPSGTWATIQEGRRSLGVGWHRQTLRFYYNTFVAADTVPPMGGQRGVIRISVANDYYRSWYPSVYYYNNILYNPDTSPVMMPYDMAYGDYYNEIDTETVDFHQNWITGQASYFDGTNGRCDTDGTGCVYFLDPIYSTPTTEDPFVNRATRDFNLKAGSSPIGRANQTLAPTYPPTFQYSSTYPYYTARAARDDLGALDYSSTSYPSTFYVDPDYAGATRNGSASNPWNRLDTAEWAVIDASLAFYDVNVYYSAREAGTNTDETTTDRVRILRTNGSTHRVTIDGMSMYNTNDTTPSWATYTGSSRLNINYTASACINTENVLRHYVTVRGFKTTPSANNGAYFWGGNDLIFEYNTNIEFYFHYAWRETGDPGSGHASTGVIVRNNTINGCDGECIYIGGSDETYNPAVAAHSNVLIENNTVSNAGSFGEEGDGIDIKRSLVNVVIRNNTLTTGIDMGGGATVAGIMATSPITAEYNTITGFKSGIRVTAPVSPSTTMLIQNNVIYNNVSGTTDRRGIWCGPAGSPFYTPMQNADIYNNTVVDNPVGIYIASGVTGAEIKNNIFYSNDDQVEVGGTGNTFDYNLYNPDHSFTGKDAHYLTADPQFVNYAGHDFHLLPTSPACDGGEYGTYMGAYQCTGECVTNADCNDSNVCTADTCTDGTCYHTNVGGSCNDGLFCTGTADTCVGGVCVGGSDPCPFPPQECNHCNETNNNCYDTYGTSCGTGDFCDLTGHCIECDGTHECPETNYCDGEATCNGGACEYAGDPCPNTDCHHCNETDNNCIDPEGTACTGGTCDDAGNCVIEDPSISGISNVSPGTGRLGDQILITGTNFGASQGSGYVAICGLKIPTCSSWTDTAITCTLPILRAGTQIGAHSGLVYVTNNSGRKSNGENFDVNYWGAITSAIKITDPEEFTIKDAGLTTTAQRVEAEDGWAYIATSNVLHVYATTTSPPTETSVVVLPAKVSDLVLDSGYLFVTGGFGVEIYDTAYLKSGSVDPNNATVTAGFTGEVVSTVAIADFAGVPVNGAVMAAPAWRLASSNASYVYLFIWDRTTKTLEYKTYVQNAAINNQIIYGVALWPDPLNTTPKLEVGECNATENDMGTNCDIEEFSLGSNFTYAYVGSVDVWSGNSLGLYQIIGEMKIHDSRLWISLYGNLASSNTGVGRYQNLAYTVSAGALPAFVTGIEPCAAEQTEGYNMYVPCKEDSDCPAGTDYFGDPMNSRCINDWCFGTGQCDTTSHDCPRTNDECVGGTATLWSGWCRASCTTDDECKNGTTDICPAPANAFWYDGNYCRCIDGYCASCRQDRMGSLDLIPPDYDYAVSSIGISEEMWEVHNIFLFQTDVGAGGRTVPIASADSIDWNMDIAGTSNEEGSNNKIVAANEWVNTQIFNFTTSPASISTQPYPSWQDISTRIHTSGWMLEPYYPVIYSNRIYFGEIGIFGANTHDLSNFTQWNTYNQDHVYPYGLVSGDVNDDGYLFGNGPIENFLTSTKGTFLQVHKVNPTTGELRVLNDPYQNKYLLKDFDPTPPQCFFAALGGTKWLSENAVLTGLGNYGLSGYYVVPDNLVGTCAIDSDCDSLVQCQDAYGPNHHCICAESGQCQYATIEETGHIGTIGVPELDCKGSVITGWALEAYGDIIRIPSTNTFAIGKDWSRAGSDEPDYDWGGLYFYNVDYSNPSESITITQSDVLNCTLGHSDWSPVEPPKAVKKIDMQVIDGDPWFVVTLDEYDIVFNAHTWYIMVFNYNDLATLNSVCSKDVPDSTDCNNQRTALSMEIPTTANFSPPVLRTGGFQAVWYYHNGYWKIAVSAAKSAYTRGMANTNSGVYVFDVDNHDPSSPHFDVDNIHNANQFYIPAGAAHYIHNPKDYDAYTDINHPLIMDPIYISRIPDSNDLIVLGIGTTGIRVGDPGVCGVDEDCDDSNACSTDTCTDGTCEYTCAAVNYYDPCCTDAVCTGHAPCYCSVDEDCDDSDECTIDTCVSNVCHNDIGKDSDSDTYIDEVCTGGDDCDDTNAAVNPGAVEGPPDDPTCEDTLDNNCNGYIDELDGGCMDVGAVHRVIVVD